MSSGDERRDNLMIQENCRKGLIEGKTKLKSVIAQLEEKKSVNREFRTRSRRLLLRDRTFDT
jgi:hypothetical protein